VANAALYFGPGAVANVGFSKRLRFPRERSDITQRVEVVEGFEVILEGLSPMVIPCSITRAVSAAFRVLPSIALDV